MKHGHEEPKRQSAPESLDHTTVDMGVLRWEEMLDRILKDISSERIRCNSTRDSSCFVSQPSGDYFAIVNSVLFDMVLDGVEIRIMGSFKREDFGQPHSQVEYLAEAGPSSKLSVIGEAQHAVERKLVEVYNVLKSRFPADSEYHSLTNFVHQKDLTIGLFQNLLIVGHDFGWTQHNSKTKLNGKVTQQREYRGTFGNTDVFVGREVIEKTSEDTTTNSKKYWLICRSKHDDYSCDLGPIVECAGPDAAQDAFERLASIMPN